MMGRLIPRTLGDASRTRSLSVAAMLALMGVLAACMPPSLGDLVPGAGGATEPFVGGMTSSPGAAEDPVLVFLAEAEDGEMLEMDDAATGTRLRVTAGRAYHAASGRVCRRYRESIAMAPDSGKEALACRHAAGGWIRANLLAPLSP